MTIVVFAVEDPQELSELDFVTVVVVVGPLPGVASSDEQPPAVHYVGD